MENYELITAEEYENLPEDPEAQFVEIERICRRSMSRMIDNDTRVDFDNLIRLQYMTTVASAAQELDIKGLDYPNSSNPLSYVEEFMLAASGIVTRIRLRTSQKNRAFSVQLAHKTKAKIQLQINKLHDIIEKSELPEIKRKMLLLKLDELLQELNKTRLSYGKVMAVFVAIASCTSFLADAPQAIATITNLIGLDKEAEDKERKRITGPVEQKTLSAPKGSESLGGHNSFGQDSSAMLDDEIPF